MSELLARARENLRKEAETARKLKALYYKSGNLIETYGNLEPSGFKTSVSTAIETEDGLVIVYLRQDQHEPSSKRTTRSVQIPILDEGILLSGHGGEIRRIFGPSIREANEDDANQYTELLGIVEENLKADRS